MTLHGHAADIRVMIEILWACLGRAADGSLVRPTGSYQGARDQWIRTT